MAHLFAFLAGFLSTLFFHQGLLALLHLTGVSPRAPWALHAVPPFGVPAVVSLAFWGGVWGVALWPLLRRTRGARHWAMAVALGAVLPSLVALLVVFPLKGLTVTLPIVIGALLVNAAWGLGLAVFLRLFGSLSRPR